MSDIIFKDVRASLIDGQRERIVKREKERKRECERGREREAMVERILSYFLENMMKVE